jgi:UDP-N-acetyl-D-mannosaminuronic acid transferase (WecB/TagA/CpsF family)
VFRIADFLICDCPRLPFSCFLLSKFYPERLRGRRASHGRPSTFAVLSSVFGPPSSTSVFSFRSALLFRVPETVQILGLRFFDGSVDDAVNLVSRDGGVLVVPAAPALVRLQYDPIYREAITRADGAIPDSGLMVLVWRVLGGGKLHRISGLAYLLRLIQEPAFGMVGQTFFVLPTEEAKTKLLGWAGRNRPVRAQDCYVAPHYPLKVEDVKLLEMVNSARPAHIVIAIGNPTQEKLGVYLRDNLAYRPAIHCIGAALGFLTGDQVAIPGWADRFYLGWLFRLFAQPRVFIPRLARAALLPSLIARYRSELPPLRRQAGGRTTGER